MKNILSDRKLNIAINVITVVLFVMAVIPFFVTTKYALFMTDDFPIANATISRYNGSYFLTGIKNAANYWRVYNGTWVSFVVAYWLHPAVHGGQKALVIALRIMLSLMLVSSVYFCYSISCFFELKKEKTLRILMLLVFPLLLFKEYFELYMWWLTSCTYMMPFFFLLFGFGTLLFAVKSGKIWQYVLAGVLLFLMSGGTLTVVGLGCYLVLLLVMGWSFYQKKMCVPGTIVFMTTFIGACITAFAPGNFTRYEGQDVGKISVFTSFVNGLRILKVEGKWLLFDTAFVAFVILAFLWGNRIKKSVSLLNVLIGTAACIMMPVVTIFPVVMGYGTSSYKDISNRGFAIVDSAIMLAGTLVAVMWGVYLKDRLNNSVRKIVMMVFSIAALASILFCGQKLSELVPVQIATNISNGYNQKYFDVWTEIYSICEHTSESNLVIEMEVPKRAAGCSWCKLKEDSTDWKNEHVAKYYGLDSISLVNLLDD